MLLLTITVNTVNEQDPHISAAARDLRPDCSATAAEISIAMSGARSPNNWTWFFWIVRQCTPAFACRCACSFWRKGRCSPGIPPQRATDGDQLVLTVRPIATTSTTPFDHQTTTNFGQSPTGLARSSTTRSYVLLVRPFSSRAHSIKSEPLFSSTGAS
jgi:hypothetical protein